MNNSGAATFHSPALMIELCVPRLRSRKMISFGSGTLDARRFLLRFEAHTMPPAKKTTGSTSGTTIATDILSKYVNPTNAHGILLSENRSNAKMLAISRSSFIALGKVMQSGER